MTWSDVREGGTVYHVLMTHWGKGIVEQVVLVSALERMFERGTRRVLVNFDAVQGTVRMTVRELRKTPNRKKIRDMVEFYQGRGVNARDGGDRLVLPPKRERNNR